mmetsp:Transcript_6010/g.12476  ORF Transcript_6010/g.12476 Transcript_6010/m.12476 type:complete len:286 (-) Transcript_6010:2083-2940(-)
MENLDVEGVIGILASRVVVDTSRCTLWFPWGRQFCKASDGVAKGTAHHCAVCNVDGADNAVSRHYKGATVLELEPATSSTLCVALTRVVESVLKVHHGLWEQVEAVGLPPFSAKVLALAPSSNELLPERPTVLSDLLLPPLSLLPLPLLLFREFLLLPPLPLGLLFFVPPLRFPLLLEPIHLLPLCLLFPLQVVLLLSPPPLDLLPLSPLVLLQLLLPPPLVLLLLLSHFALELCPLFLHLSSVCHLLFRPLLAKLFSLSFLPSLPLSLLPLLLRTFRLELFQPC